MRLSGTSARLASVGLSSIPDTKQEKDQTDCTGPARLSCSGKDLTELPGGTHLPPSRLSLRGSWTCRRAPQRGLFRVLVQGHHLLKGGDAQQLPALPKGALAPVPQSSLSRSAAPQATSTLVPSVRARAAPGCSKAPSSALWPLPSARPLSSPMSVPAPGADTGKGTAGVSVLRAPTASTSQQTTVSPRPSPFLKGRTGPKAGSVLCGAGLNSGPLH